MAVIYRCDACDKLVENDKDIIKMKFLGYPMRNGIPDNFSDWVEYRLLCPECQKKLLDFVKINGTCLTKKEEL